MMDILKAEIEKKRKLLEEKKLINDKKKFFKRSDLLQREEEDVRQQQREQREQQQQHEEGNQQPVVSDQQQHETQAAFSMDRKDVIRKLREFSQPILLFGESEADACKRLIEIETREPDPLDRGLRNDFQKAIKEVEDCDVRISGTCIPNLDEDLMQQLAYALSDKSVTKQCEAVHTYIRSLMQMWGKKLNSRPETEKRSMSGSIQSATFTQTQSYLRPLFRELKSGKIQPDILRHLVQIVRLLLRREYIQANDCYLQMAIGNAPWPIGVTMVGIHARTGREKIFSQNIAHVLNDETQRKYIQALKRLMTQAQHFFPTDPSRSVEYCPSQ